MKGKAMSPSQEDYLEAILELEQAGKSARVTDIAVQLEVSKASVNKAVGILKEAGMVDHEHYGTIDLTEHGRAKAEQVYLRHRTLKRFLYKVLGVDEDTAEKDACLMEHVISEATMDKLHQYLMDVTGENVT